MRIANHQRHAFECRYLLRRALRVTAGDENAGFGALSTDAAHSLAHLVVGGGSHGASVQHDEVGSMQVARDEAGGGETGFDGGSVGLRRTASEIFDEKTFHLYRV